MSCKVQFFVVEFWRLGHMFKWRKSFALAVVAHVKRLLVSQALQDASGVNNHRRRCLWLMYPLMIFYLMCDQRKCSDVNIVTMSLRSMTRTCPFFWFFTDSPPVWRTEEPMNPTAVSQAAWQMDRRLDKAAAGYNINNATTIKVVLDEKLRAVLYLYMDRKKEGGRTFKKKKPEVTAIP